MPHKHTPFLALLAVLIGTIGVLSLGTPSTALGADIVTCGDDVIVEYGDGDCPSGNCICYTGECSICDTQILAMNVLNWLIFISVLISALLFLNAGILYVMSPSNPGNIARAHKIFTNTLIGILLILVAWLFVDYVMKALYAQTAQVAGQTVDYGPWNNFLCSGAQYATYCVDQMDKINITGGTPPIIPPDPGPGPGEPPPFGTSYCSPEWLRSNGWPEESLRVAGCICMMESGGGRNPRIPSGCDKCRDTGVVISWGIWQINLSAHNIGDLQCSKSIVPPYGVCPRGNICSCHDCHIAPGMEGVYNACVERATNGAWNAQYGASLYRSGGWRHWATSARKCGVRM